MSNKKGRLSTDAINDIISKYKQSAGIDKHLTAHALRKSAATELIKKGVDITTVSKILGHSSISTTQKYIAELSEEKERATNMLDNFI